MDVFRDVLTGFQVALQFENLLFCFIGSLAGTLVGVLPGLGPVGAMALLIPASYNISPTATVIMFAGIYYGAQYGGSTTSILLNIPGESSSIVTCLDGYQMARNGRAGLALGISAIGSFIAGTLGVFVLILFAKPMAHLGLKFGPLEFFSLLCMGFVILTYLSSGSMARALISALMGIFLGTIGMDTITGCFRFTFGNVHLQAGINLVPLCVGMFGISEIITNIEQVVPAEVYKTSLRGLFPSLKDLKDCMGAILRGSGLGFFLGILPGGGAIISSFLSYALEKKISKHPEKFGTGVIQGLAAPESANNAGAMTAFIPLLTLGVPTNAVMALLLGALMLHDIIPGPLMIRQHPDMFWGLITSMYIGNVMLLILNLPLIPMWVKVLKVPPVILYPVTLLITMIGVYAVNNSIFDIYLMIFFGVCGYFFKKLDFDMAPLVLAFVLGDMLEEAMRQSLIMFRGNLSIFFSRPIAMIFMSIAIILVLISVIPFRKKKLLALGYDD